MMYSSVIGFEGFPFQHFFESDKYCFVSKKAPHRRATSVHPHSLDDDTILVIQGTWEHTFSRSVLCFSYIN